MTTRELLEIEQDEFVRRLANFSLKDCERYIKSILTDLKGPSFKDYMNHLLTIAFQPKPIEDDYYFVTLGLFPEVDKDSKVFIRLTSLAIKYIANGLRGIVSF